jgi:hypothetical protein
MDKGSNPTPRAYLGGLYKSNKNEISKDYSRKTHLTYRELASISKEAQEEKQEEYETVILYRRIDSITKNCSKLSS